MANPLRRRLRRIARHHERPADPVEESDRPWEDKAPDAPDPGPDPERDPHHRLNRPVGEPDPEADSDPYEE
jgi:hypothetical protein